MNAPPDLLATFALALGVGLLIGVERERRKETEANGQFAGVRTFSLVSLAGAATHTLDQPLLMLAGALFIAALGAVSYWRDYARDQGATTEVALFVTYLLGMLSAAQAALAAAGAVVVAGLLAARTPMQRFSTQTLSEQEYREALILAGAALVILPLAPNLPLAWLAGVNPYKVWLLVVLIMAVQAGGHVALRALGPRLGLPFSGLVSGFVSSTATVAAMGARARTQPELTMACVSGALLSTIPTSLQIGLIALVIHPQALHTLWPSILCAFIASCLVGFSAFRRSEAPAHEGGGGRAFSLKLSIGLALMLSGMMALVAWMQAQFGQAATYVASAVGGLADAHAAAAAVIALAADNPTHAGMVLPAVLIAFSTNSISKLIAAFAAGGVRYGSLCSGGLIAVALAAALPWVGQHLWR